MRKYQLEVLELLRHLNTVEGKTIVMVLHDINMACEYAHTLFALRDGKLVAQGDPRDVLKAELIRDVFGIDAHILEHPTSGAPMCVPIPAPHEHGSLEPPAVVPAFLPPQRSTPARSRVDDAAAGERLLER